MENKALNDMSLQELWELFPITLVPYHDCWLQWAQDEIHNLRETLSEYEPIINHIGSTAIGDILSKPIIDILIEMPITADRVRIKEILEGNGYICMYADELRQSYNKGYTPNGYADKVFHVHIHNAGDNNEIRFRDYLRNHPDVKREYEALKVSLLPKYMNDRDGYTASKSEFINLINVLSQRDGE